MPRENFKVPQHYQSNFSHHIASLKQLHSIMSDWINPNYPMTAKFLFADRRLMKLFRPNRYVNALYERPILQHFTGKCCPFVSCLDRPSKLRHFFHCEVHNTKPITSNQKTHTNQLTSDQFCSLSCDSGANLPVQL